MCLYFSSGWIVKETTSGGANTVIVNCSFPSKQTGLFSCCSCVPELHKVNWPDDCRSGWPTLSSEKWWAQPGLTRLSFGKGVACLCRNLTYLLSLAQQYSSNKELSWKREPERSHRISTATDSLLYKLSAIKTHTKPKLHVIQPVSLSQTSNS